MNGRGAQEGLWPVRRCACRDLGGVRSWARKPHGKLPMTTPPIETIAAFVASDFLKAHPSLDSQTLRGDLALRIETALRAAIEEEREECARVCDLRTALWTSTEGKARIPEQVRRDALARSNEAAYLADAIRARGP